MNKNRMVVVVLVLMIVAAGYLNHRSQKNLDTATAVSTETDGAADMVMLPEEIAIDETAEDATAENTADALTEEVTETAANALAEEPSGEAENETAAETAEETPGEAVFVESDAIVPEYFAEAKVDRENARAKSQDILYDLMANADTPEAKKTEAADEIIELQKRIENEAAAEAMIKAKGFENAFVRIYDDSVDVIVDREEITQQEAAQIQDIITRVTGVEAKNIRISLLKIGSANE